MKNNKDDINSEKLENDELNAKIVEEMEAELLTENIEKMSEKDFAKELEDMRLRSLAEMENYKKRLKKEKDEQIAFAAESVLSDLLPTLDNLDLALQYGSKEEACQNTLMGVEMTRKLLLDVVKKHGLEPVAKQGDEFNPELHEAIAQEENSNIPDGHIVNVMQKGYILKGRLLRPAKVCVSKNSGFSVTV